MELTIITEFRCLGMYKIFLRFWANLHISTRKNSHPKVHVLILRHALQNP